MDDDDDDEAEMNIDAQADMLPEDHSAAQQVRKSTFEHTFYYVLGNGGDDEDRMSVDSFVRQSAVRR